MSSLTFATLNLFNYLAPPNAFYDFNNIYSDEFWIGKNLCLQSQLQALNADIIGLQEVFSIEELKTQLMQWGYPYVYSVDEPTVTQGYLYRDPVVALASRYPVVECQTVTPDAALLKSYQLESFHFSRAPLHAVIELPELGYCDFYVTHFKSQRPHPAANVTAEDTELGRWLSTNQRAMEARILRHAMAQHYRHFPRPVVLCGDFNQPLKSPALNTLVQRPPNGSIDTLSLTDSWELMAHQKPRPATHYYGSEGMVLDYILLSEHFNPAHAYHIAHLQSVTTLDKALVNPDFMIDRYASDHAPLAITVTTEQH